MRNYSWSYGIFHWFVHYVLTIILWWASGITIFPMYVSFIIGDFVWKASIADYFIIIVISSLIDLDHIQFLEKFGFKKYVWVEKRLVAPLHNFFFLSVLSIASALSALFLSKVISIMIFSVVLHIIWDIVEDVVIFKTSYRRWEKTWGLNTKDLEDAYNELMQYEAQQPKKESRESRLGKVRRIATKLKERIRRKKKVQIEMGLS